MDAEQRWVLWLIKITVADASVPIALPSAVKQGSVSYLQGPEYQGSWPFAIDNGLTGNADAPNHLNCPFFGNNGERK